MKAKTNDEKETIARELHKPIIRKFKRTKIITNGINDIWTSDIIDMQTLASKNKGYKFIIVIVDCFSRYAWALPLKNKNSESIIDAFQEVINEGVQPKKLWTDQGPEYTNTLFKKWLKDNDIILYHTYGEHKASIAERFVKTLKYKLYKLFTLDDSENWYDFIDDIMVAYNKTNHKSIGMSPNDASKKKNESELLEKQYGQYRQTGKIPKTTIQLGDFVRIAMTKNTFHKGYKPGWSKEIFKVIGMKLTKPPLFIIKDEKDETIKGSFYENELQKTNTNIYF